MGVCGCVGVCVKARMSLETMSKQELVMKPGEAPNTCMKTLSLGFEAGQTSRKRDHTNIETNKDKGKQKKTH